MKALFQTCIALLSAGVTCQAMAETITADGFIYEIEESGEYLRLTGISDDLSNGGEISIPDYAPINNTADLLPVRVVVRDVFDGINVSKITYGANINSIGWIGSANGLKEIDLSMSAVDSIPTCFASENGINTLKLPQMLKYIGSFAFSGSNLTSVELPESLIKIDDDAFSGSSNLTNLKMNQHLKYIGEHAFMGCPLQDIEWSGSLISLGYYGFSGTKLREVIIPETAKNIEYSFADIQTLRTVKCFVESPEQIISQMFAFNNSDLSQCTLWCLPGTAALYLANPNWSKFAEIREMEQNGIPGIKAMEVCTDEIYDLSGHRVTECVPGHIYVINGMLHLIK